jgi:hypothetical protein
MMMMLRHAAAKVHHPTSTTAPWVLGRRRQLIPLPKKQQETRRAYAAAAAAATSREKRELNQQQLKGIAGPAIPKASASDPSTSPPASGGGGGITPILAALTVAGGGAAYYMGLIPGMGKVEEEGNVQKIDKEANETVAAVEEVAAEPVVTEIVTTDTTVVEEEILPQPESESHSVPATAEAVVEVEVTAVPTPTPPVATTDESKIMAALNDLKAQINRESDRALTEAHQELAKLASLDMNKLDSMTEMQLKVRLVQMAKDIEERTKWEAVRLQEFLSMKEREVEDRYVYTIDYEPSMSRRDLGYYDRLDDSLWLVGS